MCFSTISCNPFVKRQVCGQLVMWSCVVASRGRWKTRMLSRRAKTKSVDRGVHFCPTLEFKHRARLVSVSTSVM